MGHSPGARASSQPIAHSDAGPKTRRVLTHIPELDGLRGCAAAAVFVLHLFAFAVGTDAVLASKPWTAILRVVGLGSLGVDVFFVLSGFLITSLLLADRGSPAYFNNFYWKRVLRIQPVYMLHLVAIWFLAPQSHGYVLCSLLFVTNFDWRFHFQDVGPAWTLSIEEQFYLIWPQVVRRLSLRHVYLTSITVMLVSAGLRIGVATLTGHIALRDTWYRFDGLAMGALLSCQWMEGESGQSPGIRRFLRIFNARICLWIAMAVLGGSLIFLQWIGPAPVIFATNYLVYRTIQYILRHPGSTRFAALRTKPLVYLGAISYSLYMFHTLILAVYDMRIGPPSIAFKPFLTRALLVAVATLFICTLTRYLVELPAMRLRKYVLKKVEKREATRRGPGGLVCEQL